jgi:uncharacterized damage-inducible protein DinB
MLKAHFQQFAAYSAWANGRLYDQAGALADEACRRHVGAFFLSLHGTLNHLLVTDRIWLARLTGAGSHPTGWTPSCSEISMICVRRARLRTRVSPIISKA